jgi:LmbE family N-acetylglucosaminyl deacetylase
MTRRPQSSRKPLRATVIVAHPDDETLWCGGWILLHPSWKWRIITLCRGTDADRAPKFRRLLKYLKAQGDMGNLEDGPDQAPLPPERVDPVILELLGRDASSDVLFTHGSDGEYTRHRRHEECHRAVVGLWQQGRIRAEALWCFAYEDGGGAHLPVVSRHADRKVSLPEDVWLAKQEMIVDIYGFSPTSWEARAVPREEGFRCFNTARAAVKAGEEKGIP